MFEQIQQIVQDQLQNNDFLSGGAMLMVMGGAMAALRNVPHRIYQYINHRAWISVEVGNDDEAFEWLRVWLAHQNTKTRRIRDLSISTEKEYDKPGEPTKIIMSPAPGTHWLFWRGRLTIVRRVRQKDANGSFDSTPRVRETIEVSVLSRNKSLLMDIVREAQEMAEPPSEYRVSVHSPRYDHWSKACKKKIRPLESVVMPEGLIDGLKRDIEFFLGAEDWYAECGIPYRRGYMLYGPPGNGKSSLVFALSSYFKRDIYNLNFNSFGMSDNNLINLLSDTDEGAIILIEDIDCIFEEREKKDSKNTVSFSGLLNALDGVAAQEGKIVFMTTNHLDKLDDALIRPGRCDRKIFIDNPSKEEIIRMYHRFFPECEKAEKFARSHVGVNMATVQGQLMDRCHDLSLELPLE